MRTKPQDDDHVGFSGWRLLGLGFWQAWWMISMCTDVLLPTTDRFPFAGNTTRVGARADHRGLPRGGGARAAPLAVPHASRKLPRCGRPDRRGHRDAAHRADAGLRAAGFAWFLAGTVSLSAGQRAAAHHVGRAVERAGHRGASGGTCTCRTRSRSCCSSSRTRCPRRRPWRSRRRCPSCQPRCWWPASASRAASPRCCRSTCAPSPWGAFSPASS